MKHMRELVKIIDAVSKGGGCNASTLGRRLKMTRQGAHKASRKALAAGLLTIDGRILRVTSAGSELLNRDRELWGRVPRKHDRDMPEIKLSAIQCDHCQANPPSRRGANDNTIFERNKTRRMRAKYACWWYWNHRGRKPTLREIAARVGKDRSRTTIDNYLRHLIADNEITPERRLVKPWLPQTCFRCGGPIMSSLHFGDLKGSIDEVYPGDRFYLERSLLGFLASNPKPSKEEIKRFLGTLSMEDRDYIPDVGWDEWVAGIRADFQNRRADSQDGHQTMSAGDENFRVVDEKWLNVVPWVKFSKKKQRRKSR